MSFYQDHVYPRLVSGLGNPQPIRKVRERIIPLAEGTVLEIGVGPGVNFVHYDSQKVRKLYALEPNVGMIRLAENQRKQTDLNIEFLGLPGECIPIEDDSVDTVAIPSVVEAIRGIGRVLRLEGKFIFFEHGVSPDVRVQQWQRLREPILYRIFGGCHLTRDIAEA